MTRSIFAAIFLSLLAGYCLFAIRGHVYAQAAPPAPAPGASPYTPSDLQLAHLQLKQKDVQIAYQNYLYAQRDWQTATAALDAEGETVKKANGWPASVKMNDGTLGFAAPPVPAKPPAAKAQ